MSTDTHFTHKAWHDASDTIKKINYPMVGDPTGVISRNFDVMIEEEGLALRGTFVINRKARSRLPKSTTWASVARQKSWCARFRQRNTLRLTTAKCALRLGSRVLKPWHRRWIWSARFNCSWPVNAPPP